MSIDNFMSLAYILGFIGFSYVLHKSQAIIRFYRNMVEEQQKIINEDLEIVARAQDSVVKTIKIANRLIKDPDKYPESIESFKQVENDLEELRTKDI